MFKGDMDIVNLFLWLWVPVSLVIFGVIGWNYMESSVYRSAYQAGVETGAREASAQIYTDIINKSGNQECNTVFIQYEGRRVDLINVQCLQIQQPATEEGDGSEDTSSRG